MPLLIYLKRLPGMMMTVKGDAVDKKFFKKGPKIFYSQLENHLTVLRGEEILGIEHEPYDEWKARKFPPPIKTKDEDGDGKKEAVLEIPGRGRR